MKLLTKNMQEVIAKQIYNKARDIDVAVFNGLVEPEYKEFLLDCLFLYKNQDGGFGNGLEIDNYNTNSSVYQTYEALRLLNMVGIDSSCQNELLNEIMQKCGNYLFNRCKIVDGMWNPVEKSNNDFAHSMEYHYSDDALNIWKFHPTAAILGYILELTNPNKVYYKKAIKQLGYVFSYYKDLECASMYDLISLNSLIGSLKHVKLYPLEVKMLEEKLINFVEDKVKMDTCFDIASVLTNVEVPSNLYEALDKCLDEKIDSIKSHGLWEYKKDWGTDKYAEFDSAKLKWIGATSVNEYYLLMHYNRLEK